MPNAAPLLKQFLEIFCLHQNNHGPAETAHFTGQLATSLHSITWTNPPRRRDRVAAANIHAVTARLEPLQRAMDRSRNATAYTPPSRTTSVGPIGQSHW